MVQKNLSEKLQDLKIKVEANLSPKKIEIMHEATNLLIESNQSKDIVKIGDSIPEFELTNQDGQFYKSKDLYKNQPIVITFYRGVWCPYCNIDLKYQKKAFSAIQDLRENTIVISPSLPLFSQYAIKRFKLPFNILTDYKNQVAEKFGLAFQVPEDLKKLYLESFDIDLKKYNGDNSWTLPMPARFIIDTNGIIQYAECSPDYTKRPDLREIIQVFKDLRFPK